jgi:CheY-like chemotaxis protein
MARLLVIDDEPDQADVLATLFETLGHEARATYDGAAGLAEAAAFAPAIVFLDLNMPGLDGYEVARRLKGAGGTEPGAHPVLIALSGFITEENQAKARGVGFDYFFRKPADFNILPILIDALTRDGVAGGRPAEARGGTPAGV